jgi:hypothetical protein
MFEGKRYKLFNKGKSIIFKKPYLIKEKYMIECTIKGISWINEPRFNNDEDDFYYYYIGQFGLSERITVLDRMTGFGWRDIETGYRDIEGKFWLASGDFDIRDYPELTITEAIAFIKKNANNCIGV